ncbi:MAG: substrate-binding domain-containing protein [Proteobacteria bacterium]|nr:substrate-binding domain-containing protein [Pseudomonadota bacterium]
MNVLCASAAQGLVRALQGVFLEFTGARIHGSFGSIGQLRDSFLAGAECDVLIVTAPVVGELQANGRLAESQGVLGRVHTALATRGDAPRLDVSTSEALKAALLAAPALYCADMQRCTSSKHFGAMLRELGIYDQVKPRLRSLANGGEAMRELAADGRPGAIGCAQTTQIRYTPGINLAGSLPPQFELAMVYSAALSARAVQPDKAQRFIDLLTGARTRVMRTQVGFEAVPEAECRAAECNQQQAGDAGSVVQPQAGGEAVARRWGFFR